MDSCEHTLLSSVMATQRKDFDSPKKRVVASQMQERRGRSQANKAYDKMIDCIQYSSKPLDLLKAVNSRRTSS